MINYTLECSRNCKEVCNLTGSLGLMLHSHVHVWKNVCVRNTVGVKGCILTGVRRTPGTAINRGIGEPGKSIFSIRLMSKKLLC